MPYFSMNSRTESSSWASMKSWPSMSIGSSPGTILTLSTSESISRFVRIAAAMLNGAGTFAGNSKFVNSPGRWRMAKDMRCGFHWSRSLIFNSFSRFIMFG